LTKKVFSLDTKAGIQRDGTVLDKLFYNDGRWCRFQRGRPRKIGGYRQMTNQINGPSRGIFVEVENGYNNVFNGYNNGFQRFVCDNNGIGAGVTDFTLSDFAASDLNLWQMDGFFDATGGNNNLVLAHPGQNLVQIDSTVNTYVLAGDPDGGTLAALDDTQGSNPSNNKIEVSGGVVALHPYVFVYGNNGLIKNCSAGNAYDWNSPDANETNVASQKIVKGLPVRGGSNAPSGLFWALDSLIRVSYNPTTISTGTGTQQLFWRYDIIGSSTILSSQCVIEYDGIYYWIGVDRFLLYNGVIKEIPNDMNQNYFFDNLNYAQRQKVWAMKVTRFGEIWWFYPRGNSTECNDAIIYNVREGVWYDAGTAVGTRRTAGYFSQVFHYPIAAGVDVSEQVEVLSQSITTVNGDDTVQTAISDQIYIGMIISSASLPDNTTVVNIAPGVSPGDYTLTLSENATASHTETATFYTVPGKVDLWQHEVGVNEVKGQNFNAIESYFETNDIGLVTGGPSQASPVGDNYWIHLERLEPDFLQQEEMALYVTGRPFAQKEDLTTGPYVFSPTDGKIDLREQRREMRLKFVSNIQNGNYQLGTVLLSANVGDVRPY
jgi:hypothetical protein